MNNHHHFQNIKKKKCITLYFCKLQKPPYKKVQLYINNGLACGKCGFYKTLIFNSNHPYYNGI